MVGLLAVALTRNVLTSLTRVAIGLLLAFALDPLVVRIRNRFGWSRAEAVLAVGAVATLLVGLPAARPRTSRGPPGRAVRR